MEPIEIDVLLQEPIPIRIIWEDGTREDFLLPRLGTDGLIPWLNELTKERQAVSREIVSKMKLSGIDAARAEKSIILNDRAVIADLIGPLREPSGIRRVIALSLSKIEGMTKDRQTLILEKLMGCAYVSASLSQKLSTLFYLEGEAEQVRAQAPAKAAPANPLADPASATTLASATASDTTGSASA